MMPVRADVRTALQYLRCVSRGFFAARVCRLLVAVQHREAPAVGRTARGRERRRSGLKNGKKLIWSNRIMSLILCIETGTDICSVGLAKDGELVSLRESAEGRDHARRVSVIAD